ncbi:tail fiber protein [Aeromonas enterica]
MANLQEVVSWDAGVYQLETGDSVLGGPGGTSNKQAQALANRTAYLKQHMDDLEDGDTAAGKANKLATARNVAIAGDITGQASFDGSANITITATYKNSGVVAGTYRSVTVDAKGNITAGTNPTTLAGYGITDALPATGTAAAAQKLATARAIALAGDVTGQANFDGSGNISITTTYKNSGVTAGTYRSVTVDAKGNITAGTNPTSLAGYGITDAATKTELGTVQTGLNNLGDGTTAAGKADKLSTVRLIALAGDVTGQASFDGSGNISITATYKNSGVVAGTYRSVTVDAKGNITAGSNPTTLAGYGITDAATKSELASSEYPVGAPIPWPLAAPPVGYLMLMGQSFNKATYPKLAAAYPSGVLPDLRGEFIRGWDNNRGVDISRPLLSYQSDEVKEHKHYIPSKYAGGSETSSLNSLQAGYETSLDTNYSYGTTGVENLDGSPAGGGETRVRNVAFNYIVRAA